MSFVSFDIESGAFADQAISSAAKKPSTGSRLADAAIDATKGVVGYGQLLVGIVDLLSFGAAGKGMQAIGYDPARTNQWLSDFYSEGRKQANEKIENAKGFVDTAFTALENPSAILGAVLESVPGMVGMGAVGFRVADRAFQIAKAGARAGGATAEAATKAGAAAVQAAMPKILGAVSAAEGAQAAGSIAQQARAEGKEWADYVLPSIAGGTGTALISRMSGGIADKLGAGNIETAIAAAGKGAAGTQARGGVVSRIGKGMLTEGGEEAAQSYQEQVAQNVATGKPLTEGAAESAAMGGLVGAAMGGGNAAISRQRPAQPDQQAAAIDDISKAPDVDTAIRAAATAAGTVSAIPDVGSPIGFVGREMAAAAPGSTVGGVPSDAMQAMAEGYASVPEMAAYVKEGVTYTGATPERLTEQQQIDRDLARANQFVRDEQLNSDIRANTIPFEKPQDGMSVAGIGNAMAEMQATKGSTSPMEAARIGREIDAAYAQRDAQQAAAKERDNRSLADQARDENVSREIARASAAGANEPQLTAIQAAMLRARLEQDLRNNPAPQPQADATLATTTPEKGSDAGPGGSVAAPAEGSGGVAPAAPIDPTTPAQPEAPAKPVNKYRPHPLDDARLKDDNVRSYLQTVADDAGWDEMGGSMIMNEVDRDRTPGNGEVLGRTSYIGQDWWQGRPEDARIPGDTNGQRSREAVRKAMAGEPLNAVERRAVQWMLKVAEQRAAMDAQDQQAAGVDELGEDEQDAAIDVAFDMAGTVASSDWATMSEAEREAELDDIFGPATAQGQGGETVAAGEGGGAQAGEDQTGPESGQGEVAAPASTQQQTPSPEGVSTSDAPALDLTGQTPAEIAAEAAKQAAQAAQQAAEAVKVAADAMRESFTLAGSNRATDQAAARGQQELMPAETTPPETETAAAPRETPGTQVATERGLMFSLRRSPLWSGTIDGTPVRQFEMQNDAGNTIGTVTTLDVLGKPTVLFHIEAATQGQGAGQAMLRDVLERAEGAEVFIANIQPEAQDWWRSVGATFEDSDGANPNGTIDLQRFEDSEAVRRRGVSATGERPAQGRAAQEGQAGRGTDRTVEAVREELGLELGQRAVGRVNVVQSAADLPADLAQFVRSANAENDVQGIHYQGKVYLVADNIRPGRAFSVLMHESGVHAGLKEFLGDADFKALAGQIKVWARLKTGSEQARLAKRAMQRVPSDTAADMRDEELIAYFVEEAVQAGYGSPKPQQGAIARWFSRLWDAVRTALRKLDTNPETLTAEDVVELARGALERSLGTKGGERVFTRGVGAEEAPALSRAAWIDQMPAPTQEALRKAGVWYQPPTLKQRVQAWSQDWQRRVRQGMVDQFDPIKTLDPHAYMLARMTRSSDAALEGLLMNGEIFLDRDGAVDVKFEKGGFLGILSKLGGEHDRFLAWVVGNRAERLMGEGRENNFTPEDIRRLKALNQGQMADGSSRTVAYQRALADLNRYNKSVMDMAEKAGLVDGSTRPAWEKDFYIPFHRLMEEQDQTKGPMPPKGLVNQYAFKTLKGGTEALGDPLQNMLRNWSHLIDASLRNQAALASLEAAARIGGVIEGPEATVRQMAKANGTPNAVVSVMDKGAQRWMMVEDPFLVDALKSIGFTGFQGPAMKALQKVKRMLTLGVTVSPTFRIRNVIRDSLAMIGANPASYNVAANVLTGWKGTKDGTPEFASILAGGGVMRYGAWMEGDRAEHVKRLIKSGVKGATILNTPAKVSAAMQAAWDWWQKVGDRAENVNRVALYKKLRSEGKTHLEASYASRDVMDFSMQGTWGAIRFLSQTVPFFNARLQGAYKLGRGAISDPRRFAAVTGGVALASIALLLAYADDDDWKQREDWDRESFWWFKIGDTAYRIPKPFEIGALATIAERGLEAMITDDLTGKQFAERVWSIAMEQMSMNPVPQLFKPMVELRANKDSFTDRPIESTGMERLSTSERAGPNTSAVARALGQAGILSPVQIDHLVRAYFGWLGTHAVMTADFAARPLMGMSDKPSMKLDDYFVIGDFAKELPAAQSKYVTRLYDQGKKVQQAMADIRHYREIGELEKARELAEENREKVLLYKVYVRAERQLADINKLIRKTQGSSSMSADEKRQRLDMLYDQRNRAAAITERRSQALRAAS